MSLQPSQRSLPSRFSRMSKLPHSSHGASMKFPMEADSLRSLFSCSSLMNPHFSRDSSRAGRIFRMSLRVM